MINTGLSPRFQQLHLSHPNKNQPQKSNTNHHSAATSSLACSQWQPPCAYRMFTSSNITLVSVFAKDSTTDSQICCGWVYPKTIKQQTSIFSMFFKDIKVFWPKVTHLLSHWINAWPTIQPSKGKCHNGRQCISEVQSYANTIGSGIFRMCKEGEEWAGSGGQKTPSGVPDKAPVWGLGFQKLKRMAILYNLYYTYLAAAGNSGIARIFWQGVHSV